MLSRFRGRLTYANVMATIAVFIALGTGGAYAADTIGSSDVIDESLLSQDIKNGEVRFADLADNAVTTGKIVNGSVKQADLGAGAVVGGLGGNLADGTVSSPDIGSNQIFSAHVAENSLLANDLGINSVSDDELATDSVGQAEMETDSIGANEIRLSSVGFGEMQSDAIQTSEVADGTLDAEDVGMASGSVMLNFGTIQPRNCEIADVDVPVAIDNDTILVTPNETFNFDVVVYGLDAGSTDEMQIVACNPTDFASTDGATQFNYVIFDN